MPSQLDLSLSDSISPLSLIIMILSSWHLKHLTSRVRLGWVSDLPLAPVATSTLAFGGSALEGTKDLGRTVPSLFRFGFQDDEPELNVGEHVPS